MPAVNYRSSGPAPIRGNARVDTGRRIRIMYGLLCFVCAVFVIRLFYLQVIRHDYYAKAALDYQLKEYQIPAERGTIRVHNGNSTTPLVLNEVKYTLFADPVYVENSDETAVELSKITGIEAAELKEKLETPDTRYVVLAKRLSREQHEAVEKLKKLGVGTREHVYRYYPEGALASQTVGIVNDDGEGQYGLEQFLDERLRGRPGELRAITDSTGVPLVSNPDNVVTEPEPGESVTLTLDIGMQSRLEQLLKAGMERFKAPSGSAIIMDPHSGAVKAMANYPTFDPNKINELEDLSALANAAASSPLEIGSVMKTFTAAAAIEEGVISSNTAFFDEGFVQIGDHKITNVHNSRGTQTVESTLVESLNTGAVWILKQIGRGSIGERARLTWHSYMTKQFLFGQGTGIELAGETPGYVPGPEDKGQGIDVIYATTSFGQGMTATMVQLAGAFSSLVNGGVYYQPRLIDMVHNDGRDQVVEPVIKNDNVISADTSAQVRDLLERVLLGNIPSARRSGYSVGGKTGTAEIINPETGKYRTDRHNGTYTGFVGGDKAEYVIVVLVREPAIPGNAGFTAAAPLFRDISNMLLDNFGVTPKGQ